MGARDPASAAAGSSVSNVELETILLAPIRDDDGYRSKTDRRIGWTLRRQKPRIVGRDPLGLAFAVRWLVQDTKLDTAALVERIALAIGDCLGVGSLSRHTGALSAYFPCTEHWAAVLSKAKAGTGWAFPGVRLGPVAALINKISAGQDLETQLEPMSFAARGSRIVFQRCPWDSSEVLFAVLPDDAMVAANFLLLRRVLESVRRDVSTVRAPRPRERCLN